MTQEEKQLLLKDLCARLPYGGIKVRRFVYTTDVDTIESVELLSEDWIREFNLEESILKPYLRPMSSMTEEENDEWRGCLLDNLVKSCDFQFPESEKYIALSHSDSIDWLNAHHFDYREKKEKGLALEAPKDMYNTKTE